MSGELSAEASNEERSTQSRVAESLAQGRTQAETARLLGIAKATVSWHARRLGRPIADRCGKRYDWAEVQSFYDAGHSVRECIKAFGFSSATWFKAVQRGAVVARPAAIPMTQLLVADARRGRGHVKRRLLNEGLKRACCEVCGLADWRGQPLGLALHHVNGKPDDNRLENLQLLCPNCHSQTENFAGRNRPASIGT